jgi:small redox-active disulfide protein 2
MSRIQILGTGCPKCRQLAANAEAALAGLDGDHELEKVEDINQITAFGVMVTPALAVDGEVKSMGEVPTADQIREMLTR